MSRVVKVSKEETVGDLSVGCVAREPVYTVGPRDSLRTAIIIMSHRGVGSLVVVEEEVPIGILTKTDVVRLSCDDVFHYPVGHVMSRPLATIESDEHIGEALRILTERRIRHLPVVKNGKLKGIVTQRELLRWILEHPEAFAGFLPYVGTSSQPLLTLLRLFHLVPEGK